MSGGKKKASIYLEPQILEHLRVRARKESGSISNLIYGALSILYAEDLEDIAKFDARICEPNVGYGELVQSLKAESTI